MVGAIKGGLDQFSAGVGFVNPAVAPSGYRRDSQRRASRPRSWRAWRLGVRPITSSWRRGRGFVESVQERARNSSPSFPNSAIDFATNPFKVIRERPIDLIFAVEGIAGAEVEGADDEPQGADEGWAYINGGDGGDIQGCVSGRAELECAA
ncbi:MAG: hypothetical protein MZV70_03485 [Desulfobacterales bacterium]|nr:hypothetical protein [Desulfobacterales bacterium]